MTDISNIGDCFDLVPLKISAKQLLLDPNNPRLNAMGSSDHKYSPSEVLSDSLQKDIVEKILSSEHKVEQLVNSIKTQGFLSGTGAFVVERIPGTDKYLVLEGNRRTTAIKKLLEARGSLPLRVAKSLEVIPVNEFRYREGSSISRDDVVDVYLGTIHISGQLEWGALEKALYIYRSYLRDIESTSLNLKFQLIEESIERLATKFSTNKASIRKAIWVSRVYEQLLREDYPVESKKFSLLELCVTDRRLRKDFFGMSGTCEFSDEGLERFNALVLADGAPIYNPEQFKKFRFVERDGEIGQVNSILTHSGDLDLIYEAVREQKEEAKILFQLVDVRDRLKSLNIAGFAADQEEEDVLLEIRDIVVNKLLVLVQQSDAITEFAIDLEPQEVDTPETIDDLLNSGTIVIRELIKEAMKSFPNHSCVKDQLSTKFLRYFGLRTSGEPRQRAVNFVDRNLEHMIRLGLVEEYKAGSAGNVRVRLLVD
nr:hypothetical protein 5 [Halieaceae bacterium]